MELTPKQQEMVKAAQEYMKDKECLEFETWKIEKLDHGTCETLTGGGCMMHTKPDGKWLPVDAGLHYFTVEELRKEGMSVPDGGWDHPDGYFAERESDTCHIKILLGLTYRQYSQLMKHIFGEELQRMDEWLRAIDSDEGEEYTAKELDGGDHPWIKGGESIPTMEDVEQLLGIMTSAGAMPYPTVEAMLEVITRDERTETPEQVKEHEKLYEWLRDVLLG